MRVVLDTNQHISAIIRPKGHPAQIVRLWQNGLIELAIETEADVIVTGDQHLLSLGSYQGIPIVTAVDFLNNYV